ncbi:hypothetical protein GCM10010470_30590 [Saccharopolyspora taberi]|uniref:Transcriptional regulator n=1 Tax=Saccharopolyspora taberi TaxID=60895 RepID=A0ABN3VD50_9PSEU
MRIPGDADPRNAHAVAFYEIDHRACCPGTSQCRILIALADQGRFAEAKDLAETLALTG